MDMPYESNCLITPFRSVSRGRRMSMSPTIRVQNPSFLFCVDTITKTPHLTRSNSRVCSPLGVPLRSAHILALALNGRASSSTTTRDRLTKHVHPTVSSHSGCLPPPLWTPVQFGMTSPSKREGRGSAIFEDTNGPTPSPSPDQFGACGPSSDILLSA